VAKDTNHILLVLRSALVNEPGTWGLVGGKVDEDEDVSSAVRRDTKEELGYAGNVKLIPSHVFKADAFEFYNFLGVIPEEFTPRLDWENDDFGWFDLQDLPSPLHFGVHSLLANSGEQIKDILSASD